MSDETERIRQEYARRERSAAAEDYGYLWHPRNPVSYTYRQMRERALIGLLNAHGVRLEQSEVLDVGCGHGDFLRFAAELGTDPACLHGVDLMPERIEAARGLCPVGVDLRVAPGDALPFAPAAFDLVSQFTVFSSVLDEPLRAAMAREMDRVLKPSGHVLWYDMTIRYPAGSAVQGIPNTQVASLFPGYGWVGGRRLHYRWLSRLARRSWWLAELVERLPGVRHSHLLLLLQKP